MLRAIVVTENSSRQKLLLLPPRSYLYLQSSSKGPFIYILRKHWTEWVGSEIGHICLLKVHREWCGWVKKSPKSCLRNI